MNKGEEPTFVRRNSSSIIDITCGTNEIAKQVHNWRVLPEETLSDHKYLFFEVRTIGKQEETTYRKRKWILRKINWEIFTQKILEAQEGPTIETREQLILAVKQACDESMPKIKSGAKYRKAVYWWSEDIALQRKKCIEARRTYTREKRRGQEAAAEEASLAERYKEEKKKLRNMIKNSKEQ